MTEPGLGDSSMVGRDEPRTRIVFHDGSEIVVEEPMSEVLGKLWAAGWLGSDDEGRDDDD